MSESDPNSTPRPEAAAPEGTPAATPATPAPDASTPTPPVASPPLEPPQASTPPTPSTPEAAAPRRIGAGALVAVAAAAALVGGASGAGIAAWAVSTNVAADQSSAEPQTITVNDPDSVNVVNAVAAKAGPSVVTIAVSSQSAAGTGSGVILSEDGYILTNNHVVTLDGASGDGTIEVTTADGHIYQAEIVGTDPIVDLAVIKLVDADGLTPIDFGDVDALDVGDRAVVIGAPLGLANTVTDGIISVLNRSIQIASSAVPDDGTDDGTDDEGSQGGPFNFDIPGQDTTTSSGTISLPVIQTDASINPGNSGGALVNDSGELIGIVVAIASAGGTSTTAGSIGVGFAIPADLAQRVATEIIENGTATHGLLGATVRDASSADGSTVGAVIDEVTAGGAGAEAGLQKGDIVTELDGVQITGSVDLTAQVRLHGAGDEAELVFIRNGQEQTVTVTLGEYQAQ
ncbi:S1C family serine protease [Pseudolysinimonas sp.]|jgi:putative serine protease PepD|uniref:S1C family serine protease n=1 Tax=Pseudolysinimonas sp. TaxID=2680009 RepID=UPI0037846882